jgi:hypothetical protein
MHMFLALILSFLSEQTTHCDQKVVEHEVKLPVSSAFICGFFQHIQLTEREIPTTLHSMKNILKEHLTQNFTPMKVKEILPWTRREGLDKEGDKFCDGINSIYSTYIEYLDKGMEIRIM